MKLKEKLTLRSETPGCNDFRYFDNAGSALTSSRVTGVLHEAIKQEQMLGAYFFEETVQQKIVELKFKLAKLVGARSDQEIALVDSASRAWSSVLNAIPFQPGDSLVTSCFEYGANWATFEALRQRFGVDVRVLPMTSDGEYDIGEIEKAFTPAPRLLALTLCPSSNGIIVDVAPICRLARERNVLVLIDACQAVGQVAVDVEQLQCDFLTGTGRKFLRGSRGTGFLYARSDAVATLPPVVGDHCCWEWKNGRYHSKGGAAQFELWEKSIVNALGLLAALDEFFAIQPGKVEAEIQRLASRLRARLTEVENVQLTDRGSHLSGIVTFSTRYQMDWEALKAWLRHHGFVIGVSNVHAAPVLMSALQVERVGRISPHVYNTDQEIDELVEILGKSLQSDLPPGC